MPAVDFLMQSSLWERQPDAAQTLRRALAEAAAALGPQLSGETELAVVLTDDAAMRELNRTWRGIDRPTNVLSFQSAPQGPADTALLGDIVIAYETAAAEAVAQRRPFAHHLAHLAVHGFLHLVGHDHQIEAEADKMEHLEREILARLGIPDPYES